MKILLGYSYFPYAIDIKSRVEAWLSRLREHGFDVTGFPLTLNPPGPPMSWQELDTRWKNGNKELLQFYERLAKQAENYDVLLNCNGINLHPEFVKQLPNFNVYACFDDPESSENLSKPAAIAYDLALVGNIACVDLYKEWGVREVHWWPIGFHPYDFDPALSEEKILNGKRDLEVALLCERASGFRDNRLEKFAAAFSQGAYFGKGWENGFLPENERVPMYQRTKIGPNFHNSIGPVNSRTFVLPANGVMQLCDNKSYLSQIFKLGEEVVGFDSIEEAIELCHYYLSHEEERKAIALAGWRRTHRDYNELAIFTMMTDYVQELINTKYSSNTIGNVVVFLRDQKRKTFFVRINILLREVAIPILSAARNIIYECIAFMGKIKSIVFGRRY